MSTQPDERTAEIVGRITAAVLDLYKAVHRNEAPERVVCLLAPLLNALNRPLEER